MYKRQALHNGLSQWITGPEARADGHRWRARSCVVLTGIGTVLKDDPQLTVRSVQTPRQPRRAVVDGRFEIPEDARLFDRPLCNALRPSSDAAILSQMCIRDSVWRGPDIPLGKALIPVLLHTAT